MRRSMPHTASGLLTLLGAVLTAAAAAATPIDIDGRVLDWQHNPVANHPVSISGPGVNATIYTGSTGVFRYTDTLSPGTYYYTINVASQTRFITVQWGTPYHTGEWVLARSICRPPCEYDRAARAPADGALGGNDVKPGDDDMPDAQREVDLGRRTPQLALTAVGASPFRGRVELRISGPAGPYEARVFDVRGRTLRRIQSSDRTLVWDGRDQAGHRVTAGIYFIRATSGVAAGSARVVLVP